MPVNKETNAWPHAAEIGSRLLTSKEKSFTTNVSQLALHRVGHWAKKDPFQPRLFSGQSGTA